MNACVAWVARASRDDLASSINNIFDVCDGSSSSRAARPIPRTRGPGFARGGVLLALFSISENAQNWRKFGLFLAYSVDFLRLGGTAFARTMETDDAFGIDVECVRDGLDGPSGL